MTFIFGWYIFVHLVFSGTLFLICLGRLFSSDLSNSNRCWCRQRGRRVSTEVNPFPHQAQIINSCQRDRFKVLALCSWMLSPFNLSLFFLGYCSEIEQKFKGFFSSFGTINSGVNVRKGYLKSWHIHKLLISLLGSEDDSVDAHSLVLILNTHNIILCCDCIYNNFPFSQLYFSSLVLPITSLTQCSCKHVC